MTQATLRAVTLETVDNYRQIAALAVGAYRASGYRVLGAVGRGVDRSAARITPQFADALRRTSEAVTGAAAKGIDAVSTQTERAIDFGTSTVTAGVDRVATLVQGIENRYVAGGLQTAARLSLSGAQAALDLSEKLVAGATRLSTAIGDAPAAAEAAQPVRKPRRAKAAAVPTVAKRTRKAKAVVEEAVVAKTPRKRRAAAAEAV